MNTQLFTDKLAISLSAICVLHCLFMPSFLILSSWFAAFSIDNEFIHYAILTVAIPVSAFALIKGFKNHKKLSYFVCGFFDLVLTEKPKIWEDKEENSSKGSRRKKTRKDKLETH